MTSLQSQNPDVPHNFSHRRWLPNALLVVVSVVVSLACIEGVIAYGLSHSEILVSADGHVRKPLGKPLALLRNYYMLIDRRIVQYLPDCAVYDPEATYTLKPSARCTIVNREYTVEYAANRAGLRDDDASLRRPPLSLLAIRSRWVGAWRRPKRFPNCCSAIWTSPC